MKVVFKMDILRYNYATTLKRSKNLAYREQIKKITTVLMTFFKENNLLLMNPFKEDGSLKEDLILHRSDFTEIGNILWIKYFPKWSAYIDRTGNITNIKILKNGLVALKKEFTN